jgi:uridine phosphorylase
MSGKILPITGLRTGSVSSNVIVCGDPQRAAKIAGYLENSDLLSEKREYRVYRGNHNGKALTVCSHGVGAPGAAIAFEELISAGARRILRVGSCGALQPDIESGHLIIACAAVQNTGYGREIAPPGYPAAADPRLTIALQDCAASYGHPHRYGLVLTRDVFYGGVASPDVPDYHVMSKANVLAVEMECAALFMIGQLRATTTAAILAVDGNVLHGSESMDTYKPHREIVTQGIEAAIAIALQTLCA